MGHLQELINLKKDFGSGEQDFRPDMPQYSDEGIKKTNELLEVVSQLDENIMQQMHKCHLLGWLINMISLFQFQDQENLIDFNLTLKQVMLN